MFEVKSEYSLTAMIAGKEVTINTDVVDFLQVAEWRSG